MPGAPHLAFAMGGLEPTLPQSPKTIFLNFRAKFACQVPKWPNSMTHNEIAAEY
jgi:hypothetical protein